MPGETTEFDEGLLLVHTGDGKGKTTAALGLAMRALGHDIRVLMIQFVKGGRETGECRFAARMAPEFTIAVTGRGFVIDEWAEEDIAAARRGWEMAGQAIRAKQYGMIILDEITYVVNAGVVTEAELLELLSGRPDGVCVVVTGRDAPDGLIQIADLVTEMTNVKHHHDAGVRAQAGIEY